MTTSARGILGKPQTLSKSPEELRRQIERLKAENAGRASSGGPTGRRPGSASSEQRAKGGATAKGQIARDGAAFGTLRSGAGSMRPPSPATALQNKNNNPVSKNSPHVRERQSPILNANDERDNFGNGTARSGFGNGATALDLGTSPLKLGSNS